MSRQRRGRLRVPDQVLGIVRTAGTQPRIRDTIERAGLPGGNMQQWNLCESGPRTSNSRRRLRAMRRWKLFCWDKRTSLSNGKLCQW